MAKKEIVELPDKHTGDIQEIRDKLIALASDATGASDITSQCEYLIKNGQTGEFMNVLKNYIDESIRNALGALVNNLDKGSSISKILATDASNDLGSITPANLASVLSASTPTFKGFWVENPNSGWHILHIDQTFAIGFESNSGQFYLKGTKDNGTVVEKYYSAPW